MPISKMLPDAARDIAIYQGWYETSILIHVIAVAKANIPDFDQKLEAHFQEVAEEENALFEDGGMNS